MASQILLLVLGFVCLSSLTSGGTVDKPCHERTCKWSSWSSWSQCSNKCGCGTRTRGRHVATPPACGAPCNGQTLETAKCCSHVCCKKDCLWGNWTDWSACQPKNGKCGDGKEVRSRRVKQYAACGGSHCEGPCEQHRRCNVCCPKNCVWNAWESWSQCSVSCGEGTRSRCRTLKEHASCDGTCEGQGTEIEKCSKCCPRDCRWNPWGTWSPCKFLSGTCGPGINTRTRTKAVEADCGGKKCVGNTVETKSCSRCCPHDCKWKPWSPWGQCNFPNGKCGTGILTRTRGVAVPASCGGKACHGENKETKTCTKCCPKACKWGAWSKWSSCNFNSGTCGTGYIKRTRSVASPAECNGAPCTGPREERKPCSKCCPRNCQWKPWSSWGACKFPNGKCGDGHSKRTRSVAVHASCGGKPCEGKNYEKKACSKCCPKNCRWGKWSSWSSCIFNKGTCGAGYIKRTRQVAAPAECGGKACGGPSMEKKPCTKCCPRNCQWKPWSHWSACSFPNGKCGNGQSKRTRGVAVTASCGGKQCEGKALETRPCSKCCPKCCTWGPWSKWSDCIFKSGTCGGGHMERKRKVGSPAECGGAPCKGPTVEKRVCSKCCPKDCQWKPWSPWTSCKFSNGKCGNGYSKRTRSVAIPASCGGKTCAGKSEEKKSCSKCCPKCCKWGPWSKWSDCIFKSGNCGTGHIQRSRKIASPAECGGDPCKGPTVEVKKCSKCCPRNCQWKPWSPWTSCKFANGKCGNGYSKRTRSVAVKPTCGGNPCQGSSSETKTCLKCCPKCCKWGPWTPWSSCEFNKGKCGPGKEKRTRVVAEPAQCGGAPCKGPSKETRKCNKCCPQCCLWDKWSKWSSCEFVNGKCGLGTEKRTRKVSRPATCGGDPCKGSNKQTRTCNKCCPTDCEWSNWTEWSECSGGNSCYQGSQSRHRHVTKHAVCGGKKCQGPKTETRSCHLTGAKLTSCMRKAKNQTKKPK